LMVEPIWKRPGDLVVLLYFLSHIPITILIDSQVLLRSYITYPKTLLDVCDQYVLDFQDKLVGNPPLWFQVFTACELLVQLPFFFFASYAYYKGRNWIRIPAIVYGVHVVTTLVPILAVQFLDPQIRPTDNVTLACLASIYSIYLFIPLYIVLTNIFYEFPFSETSKVKKN